MNYWLHQTHFTQVNIHGDIFILEENTRWEKMGSSTFLHETASGKKHLSVFVCVCVRVYLRACVHNAQVHV